MTGPTMSQDPPAASSIAGRHGLIRPKEQRQVAGVCIGVARATGTDPMLWRVLVAVGVLFGGVGLVAYLLGWLIMPEEDDTGSPLEALLGRGRSSTSGIVTVILAVATALLLVITVEWTPITLVVLAVVGFVMYRQRKPDSPWPPAGTPPTGPFPGPPQGPMPGPPQGPHPDPAPQGPPPGPFPPRAAGPALGPPPGPFPPSGPSQRPSVPQVPPPDEPRAGSATVPHSMSRQDAVTVPVPPESAATMPADAAPEPAAGAPDGAPTAPGDTTGAGGTGQTAEGSQHAGDPNRDTGENPEPLTEQSYVSDLASGAPVEPIIDQEPGPEASTEPDSAEDPAAGTRSAEDLATEQVTGAVSEQPTVPLAISGVPPQVPVPGHGPAGSHPPGPATDDTELLALAARYRDGTAAPPQWSPPPTPSLPPTPSTPPTPSPPPAPRPRRSRLGRVALFAMLIAIGLVAVLHLSGAP
ncbi:MAG: PspC domain-containing protein, partial [Micromonosporaceae bacterium]